MCAASRAIIGLQRCAVAKPTAPPQSCRASTEGPLSTCGRKPAEWEQTGKLASRDPMEGIEMLEPE